MHNTHSTHSFLSTTCIKYIQQICTGFCVFSVLGMWRISDICVRRKTKLVNNLEVDAKIEDKLPAMERSVRSDNMMSSKFSVLRLGKKAKLRNKFLIPANRKMQHIRKI